MGNQWVETLRGGGGPVASHQKMKNTLWRLKTQRGTVVSACLREIIWTQFYLEPLEETTPAAAQYPDI